MTKASETMPVTVFVTYQGTPETRFDRNHYVNVHLPLVMKSWQQYGLESLSALFPAVEHSGTIALCECRFRDEAAMEASFSSPETPEVMADVACFTDVEPRRYRANPL